jgi:hypothetical protein
MTMDDTLDEMRRDGLDLSEPTHAAVAAFLREMRDIQIIYAFYPDGTRTWIKGKEAIKQIVESGVGDKLNMMGLLLDNVSQAEAITAAIDLGDDKPDNFIAPQLFNLLHSLKDLPIQVS